VRQAAGLPAKLGVPRSRRGPRVKPFTPDPVGPSESGQLPTPARKRARTSTSCDTEKSSRVGVVAVLSPHVGLLIFISSREAALSEPYRRENDRTS